MRSDLSRCAMEGVVMSGVAGNLAIDVANNIDFVRCDVAVDGVVAVGYFQDPSNSNNVLSARARVQAGSCMPPTRGVGIAGHGGSDSKEKGGMEGGWDEAR